MATDFVYAAYDFPFGNSEDVWRAELEKLERHLEDAPDDAVADHAARLIRQMLAGPDETAPPIRKD